MSSKSMGTLSLNLVANTGSFEEGTTRAQRATEKLNKAVQRQKDDLQNLIGQIDPVVAEYNRLDKMEQQLRKHREKKLIDDNDFKLYNTRIQQMRDQVGKASIEFDKNGLSAKQMAFALRGVPAQFTDIAVSLQAGQNPLTVFLQQGGQLKDMFGGVGPAARAMGGYILGLVNPFTTAAAAAGVLALAYYQGSIEADHFRNALILTGNASGTTVDGLTEMARRIDGVSGTQRQASAALAEIANTGKFTAEQIELVGLAAVQMENVTGKAVSDTIAEFEKLSKEPAKSVAELNEKYNFLTADIYEQIKALEQQGRTQEAVSMAVKAYADAVDQRTGEITENLGFIEGGWKSIKSAAAEAWDEILGIGRTSTLTDQVSMLDKQISEIESRISKPGMLDTVSGGLDLLNVNKSLDALKQQREQLQFQLDLEESKAAMMAEINKIQKDSIAAQQAITKVTEQAKTNDEKRAAAIKDYYANIEKIRAANPESALLNADKIAKDIKAIEEQFKQTTKEVNNTAAQQMMMRLREQEAALLEQLNIDEKVVGARRELLKFEQQITDLKGKGQLTAAEKSLLADEAKLRKQFEVNAAIEEEFNMRTAYGALLDSLQTKEEKATDQFRERLKVLAATKDLTPEEMSGTANKIAEAMFSDAPNLKGLSPEIGGPAGELDRIAEEESKLNEWYKTQTDMLNAARAEQLDANIDWNAQELALKQQHEDALQKIEFQRRTAGLAAMSEFFSGLAVLQQSESTKARRIGKAAAITQATINTYESATGSYKAMAGIPYVGPVLGAAAAAAAIATGMANVNAIRGQAHNGLDYIPSEGTWILDKGERVLSPRQNEDLTRFLGAVNQDSGRAMSTSGSMGRKVDLNFNFSAMDNGQLMEMLMENRGTIAGMVSSAFEDQGVSLGGR
jgi:hypothetical protein